MFGFLSSHSKDADDPLVSPRGTAVWLKQLPAQDVIGRQQHVMRAFEAMRQSRRPVDPARMQAVEFLDSALGADRRQLIKQYVENYDTAPKLAERIWQATYDLTQGFLSSYQTGLEEAVTQGSNPRWKPMVPLLFARLLHYYGTDAKVRVFRFERWIPGKWMELHRTYLRATELSVDRVPALLTGAGPNATSWTAEQEYLNVLLIQQLNTGNLSLAARLGVLAAARVEPQARARGRAAFARRLLRRSRGARGAGEAYGQRRRLDAPLSGHDAARRIARAGDRGAAKLRGDGFRTRSADQPTAREHPREGAPGCR